jgi:hypothetical protein
VVGCDGAHSTVRKLAGIEFAGRAYPQTFVLADLEADGIDPAAVHSFLSRDGMLFFFPLGHPATWRLLAMRHPGDPTPPDSPVHLDDVQRLADRYTGARVRLRDPAWMTNFRLHNRGAEHYRADALFVAGDAAHIHSPAGAQGMNTGIQDSVNLGWKLALVAAGGPPELLDTYEPERAPIGRRVLRLTDRIFTAATSTNPVLRFARGRLVPLVVPLALRSRRLRGYGLRTVAELSLHYRHSSASVDGPDAPRRGPKAGDRLPDARVVHDGRSTSLHELVAAPGFHLLLAGPDSTWPDRSAEALCERHPRWLTVHRLGHLPDRTVRRRLGVRDGRPVQLLVRPDGYLGYRAGGNDLTGLDAYLDRWLGESAGR